MFELFSNLKFVNNIVTLVARYFFYYFLSVCTVYVNTGLPGRSARWLMGHFLFENSFIHSFMVSKATLDIRRVSH